jgi:hypothetical protein
MNRRLDVPPVHATVGRSTAISFGGCSNRRTTWRLVHALYGYVITAVSNGGYRACRRLKLRQVPVETAVRGYI